MKNKIHILFFWLVFFFSNLTFHASSEEQFNFDVTEIEILNNGNLLEKMEGMLVPTMVWKSKLTNLNITRS